MHRTARFAIAAFAAVAAAPAAHAAGFYEGKTIEVIVGVPPGGGYDQYARTIARHVGRHIPGNPNFIVKNMPGASSMRAANAIYNVLPQDGTVIGAIQREAPMTPLLYPKNMNAKFNAAKFNWLGSPQQELGLLLIARNSPAQTLEEMKSKEVVLSSTGRGSATSTFPRVLNAVFGYRFKVVEGYQGSQESLLAMENGEVQGHASSGSSANFRRRIDPWLKKGDVKVLMQLGFTKDPAYANVPLVMDMVKDAEAKKMLRLVFTPQLMGRPLLVGPRVPKDRVALLRNAFDATMKDAKFLADANKQKLQINPVSGREINEILEDIYATPEALLVKARAVVGAAKK